MSKRIFIFDTTLRDGEQTPGVSLNVHEKLQIAKQLEKLGADVIEAGFPVASNGDFEAVMEIAKTVSGATVAALARTTKKDIDRAWEAIKYAAKPRIHTFIAVSGLHMKYKLKMEPEAVLKAVSDMVAYAKGLCPEVEFSPEDATRADRQFLYKVVEAAITAGADVVNIPDTVGYMTPEEFGGLIKDIRDNVPNIHKAVISVHCHDDLGMAAANSLAAVENGAEQVECTINGLGERAGNAALEEVVMMLRTRRDYYNRETGIHTEMLYRTSKMVSHMSSMNVQDNKAIVGANAFVHESGIHQHGVMSNRETYEIMTPESVGFKQDNIVLGKHSGRHALEEKLREMGYGGLENDEIAKIFTRFKDLADRKKFVMDDDIEALVGQETSRVSEAYSLEHFQITSGSGVLATSTVRICHKDDILEEAACGDGPVDATFRAIERAVNMNLTLEDYFIKAATGGTDALGKVTVKISDGSTVYVGHGASTDIIEASARAYVNAINNMLYSTNAEEDSDFDIADQDCNYFGEGVKLNWGFR